MRWLPGQGGNEGNTARVLFRAGVVQTLGGRGGRVSIQHSGPFVVVIGAFG